VVADIFIGDGSTTSGLTSQWAYYPGSMGVMVNGIDWSPYINETNPATGAYGLDYPFPFGATVLLAYRRST
jgi:hypothetical protein